MPKELGNNNNFSTRKEADIVLTQKEPDSRFCFVSDKEIEQFSKGIKVPNTVKQTTWELNNFEEWNKANERNSFNVVIPDDFYKCTDKTVISNILSRFVLETRKENGERYTPKTIHSLLSGLLRHMREMNVNCPNFLEKSDSNFKDLHGTLGSLFHQLHSDGIGLQVKHAKVLSNEDERKLWDTGVMGTKNPKALQNAVFYIVGKHFSLRGGAELRNLKRSQIVRFHNPDRYVYHEHVSKIQTAHSES